MKAVAISLAVLVAVLGGFYGGQRSGRATTPSPGPARAAAASSAPDALRTAACGSGGAFRGGADRGALAGVVTVLEGGRITLHDPRCNVDVSVMVGSDVTVRKTVPGQSADLQVNIQVTVQGERQPDGSVRAQTITIVGPIH